MYIKTLFPLTVAALLSYSLSAVSMSSDLQSPRVVVPTITEIVDLPGITVRPAAEDAAFYQANKIVDLATLTVRPEPQDLAYFVASRQVRAVDFPVVSASPRAEVEVTPVRGLEMTQQVASR